MNCTHQAPLSLGILLARILEWIAMPSSRGSSQPRDQTQVFHIAGGFFFLPSEPPGKPINIEGMLDDISELMLNVVPAKMFVCSVTHSLQPHGAIAHQALLSWNFPGKNIGVGCHFLLQGIFLTQGLNPCLLHLLH